MKKSILIVTILCNILFAEDSISTVDKPLIDERINIYRTAMLSEQEKSKCSVFGSVIDQSTQEPIGNVKILVMGTKFAATTTSDGRFTLTVDGEGYFQLKMEAEGYEPQIMNNVYFKDGSPAGFFKLKKLNQPPSDFVAVEKQPQPVPGGMVTPQYPAEARKAGIEGTVWVKLWVDEKGNAREALILKSDTTIFNQPSIDAAMKWKFEPAILKSKPVAVWVSIPFKFRLDPDNILSEVLDKQPEPKRTVTPKYPASAKKLNVTGKFFLNVTVDEKGNVLHTVIDRYDVTDNDEAAAQKLTPTERKQRTDEVKSAIEEMKTEAQRAAKQWKFTPGMKEGKAVKAIVTIPIKYSLAEKETERKK